MYKFAKVLDEILDDTMLDILDGERVSKASRTAAKNLEKLYNANIPLNSGFGRRIGGITIPGNNGQHIYKSLGNSYLFHLVTLSNGLYKLPNYISFQASNANYVPQVWLYGRTIDLILATKNMELSTSEWKRKKCPAAKCLQQQAKNIRINKPILRYFLDLPISEAEKKKLMTVGMDWTGAMGYMFVVKSLDDVYVARTLHTLMIPTYVDEIFSFIETLDHLYSWRNYHVYIKDIVLEALCKHENEKFFSSVLGSSVTPATDGDNSPNIYLTPTRFRRRKVELVTQDEEQEKYQEEYHEDYQDE